MRLPGAGVADEDDVLLLPDKVTGSAVIDYLFVYGWLEREVKIFQGLMRR